MARPRKKRAWGSVRLYKPGVYYIRYPLPPDETGARKQGFEKVHGTAKDAEKRLAELRLRYDDTAQRRGVLTVSMLWENLYRPYIARLSPSTVRGYASAYQTHIEPAFGNVPLEELKKAHIQTWLDGKTYGQARGAFAVLRAMYSYAYDNELIKDNVFLKRFTMPRKTQRTDRVISADVHDLDGLKAVLEACKGEQFEAPFILSAFGGLRREEAFGVKWSDIQFLEDYAVVSVSRGVQYIDRAVVIVDVKTEKSNRYAVIPAPYCDRLRMIAEENPLDVWVCDDGTGNPANPNNVSNAYKRWHISRPFKYVPWKNLRNSYATVLHAHGVELALIARLLGHSKPTVTYQHYDRMSPEQLAEIVTVIGQ